MHYVPILARNNEDLNTSSDLQYLFFTANGERWHNEHCGLSEPKLFFVPSARMVSLEKHKEVQQVKYVLTHFVVVMDSHSREQRVLPVSTHQNFNEGFN